MEQMERYTPVKYIEAVRQVMGTIDLDPASCAVAQQTVQAAHYWTVDDNGLAHAWAGRVFLNPPYVTQIIDHFVTRLVEEVQHGHVAEAILLVNNCTETAWFQHADAAAARRCEPKGRIKFVDPQGHRTDPQRGSVFFYFGSNPERFTEIFAPFGPIR
jgi:ParB family chromosome partitioning protein